MGYVIKNDYHPAHHSGTRSPKDLWWIVLHDMEDTDKLTAAEDTGRWFENAASKGSTNFGVDNNSIQRYLSSLVIPWGAPGANTNGIHIEQMGKASWTKDQWMTNAKPTLDRTAWLIAHLHGAWGIPIRRVDAKELKNNVKGVTLHRTVTAAFPGGSHTDPGAGYPFDWVLHRALYYAK